ncbi:hypothetical protein FSP39_011331 [Pinctada imbricata]|uniref:SRCR domain-containing protein n=1 Tax=Pinctada imbricata TaxID=66713 RepID=A0AA89C747_PINIB|nr:hypothetical protein FSP39_011331 [Pinctada imbricata]
MISNVKCKGDELDLMECDLTFDQSCLNKHYASVFCSNEVIVDKGFEIRLAPDSLASKVHGIVEVKVNGIWGRVCMKSWDDNDANVACRNLGFAGGVAYLHIMKNRKPILINKVNCMGNESKLEQCSFSTDPDLTNCSFNSNDAGMLCYKDKGIHYNLVGGKNPSVGRVELNYDGTIGTVCAWSWKTADAKVLCRQLNYKDGIVNYDINTNLQPTKRWITGFFCQGNEKTLMTCLNTGFNSSFLDDLCMHREPGAYTACYNETIEPMKLRLQGGKDKYSGRLEVFVKGPNEWGTICDDFWDEAAAEVACRQLGFKGGKPVKEAMFGTGSGAIWFDNVKCFGNESKIWECNHRGIGTHNCNHTEDVGIICESGAVVSTTVIPVTTKAPKSTTEKLVTTTTLKPEPITKTTRETTTRPTTAQPTTTTKRTTTTRPPQPTTKPTTARPTTTRPTTTRPTTTQPTTTTKRTTTNPTSPTPQPTTQSINGTIKPEKQEDRATPGLAVIVAVPIALFIIALIILAIAFIVKVRKFRKQDSIPHERFHNDIIEHNADGSISVSNQLYDMDMQPTRSMNGLSDSTPSHGDHLKLSKNGNAYYSRPTMNGDRDTKHAFANPLYGQHGADSVINDKDNLPDQGEISFPIDDTVSKA